MLLSHHQDLLKVERKTKEIPIRVGLLGSRTGKKKKVTEAEYWDATYGDTHDPVTLLPIGLYELMLELER